MIAYLKGRVVSAEPPSASGAGSVVVEVRGVGYAVRVTTGTFAALQGDPDAERVFHVHAHMQEGEATLYGFLTPYEKRIFERLLLVSGVGPAVALAALSAHRAEDVCSAIAAGDTALLERVPRIGKKLAARVILDLKDKMKDLVPQGGGRVAAGGVWSDAVSALVNMGYKPNDAEAAARAARGKLGADASFEDAFRAALTEARGK